MKPIISVVFALAMLSTAAASDIPGCAHLTYGESCGFANAGRKCYVVSERKDKAIKVTVRRSYSLEGQTHDSDTVYPTPAGGKVWIGCTRGPNFDSVTFTYEIVGCEAK